MKAELRELDIQHASLAGELLLSLAACSQLTSLRATHAELPPQLFNLPALAALDVSGNDLTVLPASIGQLTGLTRLALGRNQLTALPSQISCLTNLVDLDVSRNALAQLPSAVGACTALVYLNAMANELAAAPPELGQLSRLYRLGLKSNRCACRRQLRVRRLGALSKRCSASPHGQLPCWLGAPDKSSLGFCTLRSLPADVRRAGDGVPDVAQMTIYQDQPLLPQAAQPAVRVWAPGIAGGAVPDGQPAGGAAGGGGAAHLPRQAAGGGKVDRRSEQSKHHRPCVCFSKTSWRRCPHRWPSTSLVKPQVRRKATSPASNQCTCIHFAPWQHVISAV